MTEKPYLGFEAGPIRPPSEAYSLLLRLVRGCAWNKCKFCAFYRGERFAVRPVEHVLEDIREVKYWIDSIQNGNMLQPRTQSEQEAYYVAVNWYRGGMESVFLQDGNSLLTKPENMLKILGFLRETFPQIERITAYARSDTIANIGAENLKKYAELGLNRFHIGMETGSDTLLKLVNKGTDKKTHIHAGKIAMDAGIEVSEFYMPALGGREYARESAIETAKVLNEVNPDFIRIRSMALSPKLDLYKDYEDGIFTRCNDIETIEETRLFLENLDGVTGYVDSDHILNILLELRGQMPEDKDKLLGIIDRFLNLPEKEQMIFRLGRRVNAMSYMDELNHPHKRAYVENLMAQHCIGAHNIDEVSNELMINAIPIQDPYKD